MSDTCLRVALVSTPRSGNCWLRHMLAQVLELQELAVDQAADPLTGVDWQALPERAILAMHWMPDEPFVARLAEHGFRPLVIVRHPLDVLISILVFSQHDESTLRWLAGEGGGEQCLEGAAPLSEVFRDYATGPRGRALLGISAAWWSRADVCRVRYEELAGDAASQLSALVAQLGVTARRPVEPVAATATPDQMRALQVEWLYHVWQAQPGLWRRLLTVAAARQIAEAHGELFGTLGYACDADEALAADDAQRNWDRVEAAALKRSVNGLKKLMTEAESRRQQERAQQQAALTALARRLDEAQQLGVLMETNAARLERDLARQRVEMDHLARQFADLPLAQIRELAGLGPWSVSAARTAQRLAQRFPRLAAGFKSLLRLTSPKSAPEQRRTALVAGPHRNRPSSTSQRGS